MSDARWSEVEADVAMAVRHFTRAVEIYRTPAITADDGESYVWRMAFMHAMQAGHTSLENALLRILELHHEEAPSGRQWHADLIARARRAFEGRPPILPAPLARAADRTRRFWHIAIHAYDTFDPDDAEPAVRAAGLLAGALAETVSEYRRKLDP